MIFVVQALGFSALRIPFLLVYILGLCFLNFSIVKVDKFIALNFLMVLYTIVQSLIIQQKLTLLVFIQAVVSVSMYLIFYLYNIKVVKKIDKKFLESTSYYLLFFLPVLLVSIVEWNIRRSAGLLGNPNVSAHTLLFMIPFVLMVKRTKLVYSILAIIVLICLVQFASRSAMLAFIFGVGGYLISMKWPKNKFILYLIYVGAVIYLSYEVVEIMKYFLDTYGYFFTDVNSRLLETTYNSRDVLFEQAFQRFQGNEFWGLGFDGAKFNLSGDHELSTHNGFLEILFRLGIGGLTIFGALLIYMLKKISQVKNNYLRSAAFMSFVIMMSLSTNSSTFFVFNFFFYYLIMIYCIAVFSKTSQIEI